MLVRYPKQLSEVEAQLYLLSALRGRALDVRAEVRIDWLDGTASRADLVIFDAGHKPMRIIEVKSAGCYLTKDQQRKYAQSTVPVDIVKGLPAAVQYLRVFDATMPPVCLPAFNHPELSCEQAPAQWHSIRTAAVELGCSDQLVRYYCRKLGVGQRRGRAPRGMWILSGRDVNLIAEHRRGVHEPIDGLDARAQVDGRRIESVREGQDSREWLTTAEVAALLGVTERAVRSRAAVRGVGSRAHARLATYSPADLAALRRSVPRGRPARAADPV